MTTTVRESLAQQGFTILKEIKEDPLRGVYIVQNERTADSETMYILRTPASDVPLRLLITTEAQQLQQFDNEHVLALGRIGVADSFPFACYENREGTSLAELIEQKTIWDQREVVQLFLPVVKALVDIHQHGWIHGRLMPDTLWMTEDNRQMMIAELGLSYLFRYDEGAFPNSKTHRIDRTVLNDGTLPADPGWWNQILTIQPEYCSPEQAQNHVERFGPETDIYSLGCVLYELLTQRPPLQGATGHETLLLAIETIPSPAHELNPEISESLSLIVQRCLEKDPNKRYRSAEELANDLEAFLGGHSIPTGIDSHSRKPRSTLSDAMQGVLLACGIILGFIGSALILSGNVPSTISFNNTTSNTQQPRPSPIILTPELIALGEKHLEHITQAIQENHPRDRAFRDRCADLQRVINRYQKTNHIDASYLPELARQSAKAAWIASCLDQEDHALSLIQLTLQFRKQMSQGNVPTIHEQAQVAESAWYLGKTYRQLDLPIKAKKWYQLALKEYSQFATTENHHFEQYCQLAADEAELYVDVQDLPGSLKRFQQATSLLTKLLSNDSANPRYRLLLTKVAFRRAEIQSAINQRVDAIRSVKFTLETGQPLLNNSTYQETVGLLLAQASRLRGILLLKLRKVKEARKAFQDTITSLTKQIQANPAALNYQKELLITFNTELQTTADRGNPTTVDAAIEQIEQRFQAVSSMLKETHSIPLFQANLHLARAMRMQKSRKWEAATIHAKQASTAVKGIASENAIARKVYLNSLSRLGKCYVMMKADKKAIDIYQQLCKLQPDAYDARMLLAESFCRVNDQTKTEQFAGQLWTARNKLTIVQQFDLACVYGKLLKMNAKKLKSPEQVARQHKYQDRGIELLKTLHAKKVFARALFRRHLLKDGDLELLRSLESYQQIARFVTSSTPVRGSDLPSRDTDSVEAMGN